MFNWTIFYLTYGVAFFLSYPMFHLLNAYGKLKGIIPPDDQIKHFGRRFSQAGEETTLTIGNPYFFAFMDACIITSFSYIEWTTTQVIWASASILIGSGATYGWFKDATRNYHNGKIPSWGWQWCGPNKISPAGYYHTAYFLIQSIAIASVVTFFLWQGELSIHVKMGMIFGLSGYIATFLHFVFVQNRLKRIYDLFDGALSQLQAINNRNTQ